MHKGILSQDNWRWQAAGAKMSLKGFYTSMTSARIKVVPQTSTVAGIFHHCVDQEMRRVEVEVVCQRSSMPEDNMSRRIEAECARNHLAIEFREP